MKPELIYHAVIKEDDLIDTVVFDGEVRRRTLERIPNLAEFSRARTFTTSSLDLALGSLSIEFDGDRGTGLQQLENERKRLSLGNADLADYLAYAVYDSIFEERLDVHLPDEVREGSPYR